jgi:phosphonate metabolism-associated iron-containing alcohol dehydrogenase
VAEWSYHNPVKVRFGSSCLGALADLALSRSVLLVTTAGATARGLTDRIKELLGEALVAVHDGVLPNPTFSAVDSAVSSTTSHTFDLIVAAGGGSTIDTAKAIAAVHAVGRREWLGEHLRNAEAFPVSFEPLPIIAVPTTAGTGSEVTMWATIWDMDSGRKYSLSHPSLYPEVALVDPELTLSLPTAETIHGGLDAISQALEAIWNRNANPVSDVLALEAIELAYRSLPVLQTRPGNATSRADMLRASLVSGLAFSNTRTALAHSISYPLTARHGLPHGLACALPLPHLLRLYLRQLSEIGVSRPDLPFGPEDLADFIEALGVSLSLRDHGVPDSDLDVLVSQSFTPGRADNFILPIGNEDLRQIISDMYGGRPC